VDCLQRPGRDLSTFKANVLDKLATRAWYLHNSADGRLFFKNQQNLAAKLRATALSLHSETVDRMLREHLESTFSASLRDCYQVRQVLPPPDEVQVEQEKTTLIIVRPGGKRISSHFCGLAGVVGPAAIQEPRPLPHGLTGHFPEGARFRPPDRALQSIETNCARRIHPRMIRNGVHSMLCVTAWVCSSLRR
jgi:hypothetical protein